jgi:hypothetical protein
MSSAGRRCYGTPRCSSDSRTRPQAYRIAVRTQVELHHQSLRPTALGGKILAVIEQTCQRLGLSQDDVEFLMR